jgi:hypothetical protein
MFTIKVDWKCSLPNVIMDDLPIERLWKCIRALKSDLKFHTKFHLHMCGKNIWHFEKGLENHNVTNTCTIVVNGRTCIYLHCIR